MLKHIQSVCNGPVAPLKCESKSATNAIGLRWITIALLIVATTGCRRQAIDLNPFPTSVNDPAATVLPNPLQVPVADQEFLWNQLTDEMEDYFKIRRQERTRVVDSIITEGWIETYPTIGSTVPERWRKDSTRGYEKIHATLQTVRRWARVRVIPDTNSYLLDVQVYKELEDLEYPQHASVGEAMLRHSTTPHFNSDEYDLERDSYGWIPLGRDTSLEQQILHSLQARLTGH